MKLTKSKLKQIIKEELKSVVSEAGTKGHYMGGYGERGNPNKPWDALFSPGSDDRGEDPDSNDDDAEELRSGLDLSGFELIKDRGYYFIVDRESGERVLGPFRTESQGRKRAMRPDTRSEFEAAKDVLNTIGR